MVAGVLENFTGGYDVTITESGSHTAIKGPPPVSKPVGSYSVAARKAMPSVVNISTSKEVKVPRHPFMDDPLFRRFFGDQLDGETQRASSLGSGVIVGARGLHPHQQPRGRGRPTRSRSR